MDLLEHDPPQRTAAVRRTWRAGAVLLGLVAVVVAVAGHFGRADGSTPPPGEPALRLPTSVGRLASWPVRGDLAAEARRAGSPLAARAAAMLRQPGTRLLFAGTVGSRPVLLTALEPGAFFVRDGSVSAQYQRADGRWLALPAREVDSRVYAVRVPRPPLPGSVTLVVSAPRPVAIDVQVTGPGAPRVETVHSTDGVALLEAPAGQGVTGLTVRRPS